MHFRNPNQITAPWTAARSFYHIKRSSLMASLLALTAGALAAGPSSADTLGGKADLFLTRKAAIHSQKGWSQVIVKLNRELTPAQKIRFKALGVDIYRHLGIIHALAVN